MDDREAGGAGQRNGIRGTCVHCRVKSLSSSSAKEDRDLTRRRGNRGRSSWERGHRPGDFLSGGAISQFPVEPRGRDFKPSEKGAIEGGTEMRESRDPSIHRPWLEKERPCLRAIQRQGGNRRLQERTPRERKETEGRERGKWQN